ncbi:MAG: rhomboid family intramembrane serine protease [Melioribacteraceae bacterium]|nr:rhomboid family intramembrane serine protease [Melioribacteraceae bacterium]MCF8356312.1 rhomboid family intramembrane serine protease [Melioribacteraceae bacterium]MCF8394374.1 rhomboid family intramembrane serine protease [Melioribacteraceae bacterium]MCF8420084.1 rhomboid family intramembrane serine protease [Melioribacteraceae bacterium]
MELTEKENLKHSLIIPVSFITVIWMIKLIELIWSISFVQFGVYPKELTGLIGILFFPLIHGSLGHIASNTIPVFVLLLGTIYFYPRSSYKVIALVYFIPGIFVWFFGRESYHVGASAVIYGLVTFQFFSGLIRRDRRSIALALLVTFLYGGLVWGVLPIDQKISWEGHLFGALTGIAAAVIFRKWDPFKRYDWEYEEEDRPEKLEISHDKGYPFE